MRVFGESHQATLTMRKIHVEALYNNPGATLDDIREAVTRFEDTAQKARRILGGSHPLVVRVEDQLHDARAALRVRETQP